MANRNFYKFMRYQKLNHTFFVASHCFVWSNLVNDSFQLELD